MAEVSAADRSLTRARARGLCEYCGIPESHGFVEHQIDHIVARKHGGSSDLRNLALSCALCNRYKGSDIASFDPETGQIAELFRPRQQSWEQHFRLEYGGHIIGLTPNGRATAQLLQFNRPARLRERSER